MFSGGVPLCGTCFYKRSVEPHEPAAEPIHHDLWKRLSEAIVALELLVARIGGDIDELTRDKKSSE